MGETACMCTAFFVFWADKCNIHGNCQFGDGISGNFCNISIADIYSDRSQQLLLLFMAMVVCLLLEMLR